MQLLVRNEIKASLANDDEDSLFIDPLLEEDQVGAVTIDLRLGYDFLVSVLTRKPFVAIYRENDYRSISSYFQNTRRELGDRFVLYPNQVVLTTTLEYLSLPSDVYADIMTRSSYNWPAPGSEDTKFGVTMGPEGGHAATEIYAGVQA